VATASICSSIQANYLGEANNGAFERVEQKVGLINQGVPEEYALLLRDEFGIRCFVETGTFYGRTAKWAAKRFERVVTIELSEPLYRHAAEALAPYDNVALLLGDTRQHLRELAPTLPPSIIWLDAHYSGGATEGQGDECPLLGEIEALAPAWERSYVLVDDARYFLAPPPPPHDETQWPSLTEVVTALNRGSDRFVGGFEDILVSLPGHAKRATQQYIQRGGVLNERVIGTPRPVPLARRMTNRLVQMLRS
jgi:hypothetical protein